MCSNAHFTAVVPYWAIWPFELLVLSHRHIGALADLTEREIAGLADVLRRVTARYDNLFEISFPYSMGFHQTPSDGQSHAECHLHLHFYPPLLRSATVRKFMVGFEMLGMPQRDLTPEILDQVREKRLAPVLPVEILDQGALQPAQGQAGDPEARPADDGQDFADLLVLGGEDLGLDHEIGLLHGPAVHAGSGRPGAPLRLRAGRAARRAPLVRHDSLWVRSALPDLLQPGHDVHGPVGHGNARGFEGLLLLGRRFRSPR